MEQKYTDMFEILCNTEFEQPINFPKASLKYFDYNTFHTIQNIINNCSKFSIKEWENIYLENKNNENVKFSMLKCSSCPNSVSEQIILDEINSLSKPLVPSNISHSAKILSLAITCDLPKATFKKLFNLNPECFMGRFTAQIYPPSANAITAFSEYVIDNPDIFEKHTQLYVHFKGLQNVFDGITDKNQIHTFAQSILKENGYDNIKTILLNQKLLDTSDPKDEALMNQLFDDGVFFEYIKNFTPAIEEYFVDNFINIDNYSRDELEKENIKIKIMALLKNESLSPALEYDIAMKIIKHPNVQTNSILHSLKIYILSKTSHQGLMNTIKHLPSKERREVLLNNNNKPPDVYTYAIHDICNKMRKSTSKTNPDAWYNDIKMFSQRGPLNNEDYEFLLNNFSNYKTLIKYIATSKYTPEKYINQIVNDCKKIFTAEKPEAPDIVNYSIAKLNLAYKNNLINNEQFNVLKEIVQKYYYVCSFDEQKFAEHIRHRPYTSDDFFSEMINNYQKEELNSLLKTINNLFNETDNFTTTFIPKNLSNLTELMLKDKIEEKYADISKLSLYQINNKLCDLLKTINTKIAFTGDSYNLVELYEDLPNIYNTFSKLYEEKIKRENIEKRQIEFFEKEI